MGWGRGRSGLCKINCIDRTEPKDGGVEGKNEAGSLKKQKTDDKNDDGKRR